MKQLYHILTALSIAILLSINSVVAQRTTTYDSVNIVDHISIVDGLTYNGVSDLHVDSRGFVWISTYDGLNLYDGVSVKPYKRQLNDPILPSNRVRVLAEDHSGDVWVGTDCGVAVYNYELDRFDIIENELLQQSKIIRINFSEKSQSPTKAYLMCENGSMFIYDTQSKAVDYVEYDKSVLFKELVAIDDDNFLIACSSGLALYAISQKRFTRLSADEVTFTSTVALSPKGEVVVGLGSGVRRYDLQSGKLYGELMLKGSMARRIYFDSVGGVWVSAEFDGVKYAPDFDHQSHFISYLEGLRTSTICEAEDGCMWVCSDKGVHKIDNGELRFQSIAQTQNVKLFMPQVHTLSSGQLIVKSDLKMYKYDPLNCKIEDKTSTFRRGALSENYNILVTKDDDIWQFAWDEIYLYDSSLKRSYKVNSPLINELPGKLPTWTEIDSFGNIWLGYTTNLFRLSIGDDNSIQKVESFKSHPLMNERELSRVRHIFFDEVTSSLWVGTDERGLFRLNLQKNRPLIDTQFQVYRHIPGDSTSLTSNFVTNIHRTSKGELYIATEQGGFCRAIETDSSRLTFEGYTELDGLSNNVVKSLVSDREGNLWIGTNIGLNLFNVESKQFHLYRSAQGIPFEEFRYSATRDFEGNIFFTGYDDVLYFNPLSLPNSGVIPKIYFDELTVENEVVKPGEMSGGRVILDSRLKNNDHITLKYKEMPFSISVEAICPGESSQRYIYYSLDPNNDEWTKVPVHESTIRFNSLPPGNYLLQVKASNSFGEMSDDSKLYISILPPLYRSTLAYALYLLLALIIIVIVFHVLMRFQALNHQLYIEELKVKSIKELNSEKQRYFSGISHELKTPLSLIITPLTLMQQRFRFDDDVRQKLNSIHKQANKMVQLIELAHGIQLGDENRLEMQRTNFYFDELILDISSDFEQLAKYEQKTLTIEHEDTEIEVCADYSMAEKVFTNIINNAFKYTKEGDSITIKYYTQDDAMLIVEILDTGRGISQEHLPHIFERYYTSAELDKNNSAGTGVGLAFSKMLVERHNGEIFAISSQNEQTKFVVKLPIVVKEQAMQPTSNDNTHSLKECEGSDNMIIADELESPIMVADNISSSLIYIVDDNADMRIMLDDVLSEYFNVVVFPTAKLLLEAMQSQWPDLVVSDVMMPEMSGTELCQVIKDNIATSHIPVVLLTALDTVDDKLKGYAQGADAYINKPFQPSYLVKRIEMLLQKSALLRERFRSSIPLHKEEVDSVSPKDRKLIEKLYELFEENIDNENIELESFLSELGLNRSLFFTKIKALTQLSPYELLKKYRLERAADLLLKGEYNVNEVCSMTGFKSRTHFSSLFKSTYGVTPSKYCKKE